MIRDLPPRLPEAAIISLDHDLVELPHGDPGDGLEVARFLASQPPACPIIVHSSNGERAAMMLGELTLAAWKCLRVPPFGDRWIETDWQSVVAKSFQKAG